jgi:predicted ATPase
MTRIRFDGSPRRDTSPAVSQPPIRAPHGTSPRIASADWSVNALEAVEESGQRYHEAESYRLKGKLHLRDANPDVEQAAFSFQRALDIARHQQAKSWELRAATSLARLWRDQGRRAEAYKLLAPVYGWFTEGFDTADLKDAKALLDQLARTFDCLAAREAPD